MEAKLLHRIGAAGAGLLMLAGMILTSVPAMAANQYTPVAGTRTSFTKYLVMERGTRTPAVTFSYTIESGSARSADPHDNTVMEVIPGPNPQNVTITNSIFGSDQPTYQTASSTQIDVQRTDRTEVKWETSKGKNLRIRPARWIFPESRSRNPASTATSLRRPHPLRIPQKASSMTTI